MREITEEEREFWDTHDTSEMDLEPMDILFARKTPMVNVSIRLSEEDLKKLKEIAKKHKIPYTVLIRNMIRRELRLLEK